MINHLERKRGFLPLADYAEQHSDCDLRAFPPEREVYLPRTCTDLSVSLQANKLTND